MWFLAKKVKFLHWEQINDLKTTFSLRTKYLERKLKVCFTEENCFWSFYCWFLLSLCSLSTNVVSFILYEPKLSFKTGISRNSYYISLMSQRNLVCLLNNKNCSVFKIIGPSRVIPKFLLNARLNTNIIRRLTQMLLQSFAVRDYKFENCFSSGNQYACNINWWI